MYPERLIPKNSDVPLEPIPFHYNNTKQSIPLVPFNSLQSQVEKKCCFPGWGYYEKNFLIGCYILNVVIFPLIKN